MSQLPMPGPSEDGTRSSAWAVLGRSVFRAIHCASPPLSGVATGLSFLPRGFCRLVILVAPS